MTQDRNTFAGWSQNDVQVWRDQQKIQRSYADDVLPRIEACADDFEVTLYGNLSYEKDYPLFLIRSKELTKDKPTVLITGGVHGYETSGAMGALAFMNTQAKALEDQFQFVCAPCVSPWGYETINRWNPDAHDPNRNFFKDSPAKECTLLRQAIDGLDVSFIAHFDLHETTDTDNTVFRPALQARDDIEQEVWDIPDGFYLVADTSRIEPEFQKAIIEHVKTVTHIAPADDNGQIIGVDIHSEGVIDYDAKKLHLCKSLTDAPYVTTTEVYPDSPKATPEICTQAQVAAVMGGLTYISRTAR